jgi:hypothetical protein
MYRECSLPYAKLLFFSFSHCLSYFLGFCIPISPFLLISIIFFIQNGSLALSILNWLHFHWIGLYFYRKADRLGLGESTRVMSLYYLLPSYKNLVKASGWTFTSMLGLKCKTYVDIGKEKGYNDIGNTKRLNSWSFM